MASNPQKHHWEDIAVEDSSDLEESWAGEEVMFDGSPSSGKYFFQIGIGLFLVTRDLLRAKRNSRPEGPTSQSEIDL